MNKVGLRKDGCRAYNVSADGPWNRCQRDVDHDSLHRDYFDREWGTKSVQAFTFDIDSTLADTSVRAAKMLNAENHDDNDWTAYAMACESDTPTATMALLPILKKAGYTIILVTARPECARGVTMAWLDKFGAVYDHLVMRPEGDEPIINYKVDAIKRISESYEVVMHFDDWWGIGEAVQKHLNIPTVIVRSYAPEDNRATF